MGLNPKKCSYPLKLLPDKSATLESPGYYWDILRNIENYWRLLKHIETYENIVHSEKWIWKYAEITQIQRSKKKYRPDVKQYQALSFYTKPTHAKNI